MSCFPGIWAPYTLSVFTATSCCVLSLISIFGNSLICAAVVRDPFKQLRSPFTYFLVNLAVSDLIVGAVMLPIGVYVHVEETSGSIKAIHVKLLHMCYFIAATSSIFSLMALSMDRYIAITFAVKYRLYLSWTRCIVLSCLIWVLSLTLPFMYLELGYINYLMFYSHSAVVIVLIVLIATYIKIYTFLRGQTQYMSSVQRTTTTAAEEIKVVRMKNEKRVTRTFLWILGMFIMTYVPAMVMIYILHFCTSCSCTFRHVLRDLQFLLISSNSCMNPFICTIRLKHFRKAIGRMLRQALHFRRDEDQSQNRRKHTFQRSVEPVPVGSVNSISAAESVLDVNKIVCNVDNS